MSNNPVFAVEVDYSGGFFTDVSTAVMEASISRSIADPTTPLSAGRAIVRLKNDDRKFNDSFTENLLTYSEQFDNAVWLKTALSVTANAAAAAAPDGTTTADKLIPDGTSSSNHRVYRDDLTWPIGTAVLSFYALPAGYNYIEVISDNQSRLPIGNFIDLVNMTSTGNTLNAISFEVLPNGWRRVICKVSDITGSTRLSIRVHSTYVGAAFAGDGSSGIYIWGAQLSTGAALKNYTPTTSAAVTAAVIPIGRPVRVRAENKNLLTYSEQFDNAAWSLRGGGALTPNAGTAPDGTTTADLLYNTSAYLALSVTFTPGVTYTISVWARSVDAGNTFNFGTLKAGDAGVHTTSVSITTSWVRYSLSFVATDEFQVYLQNITNASGVYVWGAQLVEGSEPLDYVRTDAEANPTYDLFTGFIQSIGHNAELGNRFATYNCYDLIQTLNRAKIDSPVFTDTPVNSLVSAVCSLAGISSYTNIDTITDVVPYFWANNREAVGVLDELVRYGHYYMFVDGGGVFNFVDRNAYVTATAQQSYSEFYGLSTQYVEDKIFNEISISGQTRRQASDVGTLAWINDAITVPGSGSVQFWLQYVDPAAPTESAPAIGVVSPVSSSDYLMSSTTSGSGDLTSTASASISTFGESALCTVYNGGGGVAYLTKFQLRGYSLQKTPQIRQTTVNSASQAAYGRKQFILESELMHSTDYARGYADFVADRYKDAFPNISASPPKNVWPDTLTMEVGNLVSLTNSHLSVSSQYVIRRLSHAISTGDGIQHLLELDLEVARTGSYLILDDASLGVLDDERLLGF